MPDLTSLHPAHGLDKIRSEWLDSIPEIPSDEVFALSAKFRKDLHAEKVDLGIGAYRSEDGLPCPLPSVVEAERRLHTASDITRHEYQPIEGDAEFIALAQELLLLGSDYTPADLARFTSVQTISGSGAVHVGAAFLSRFLKPVNAWVSDPTWGPHHLMFEHVGVNIKEYPYYDPETKLLDFDGMVNAIEQGAQEGDVVVLQACAHNPTGVDPNHEQWKIIADLCARKHLMPFFDNAYQGFASGDPAADAWPVQYFFNSPHHFRFAVAQSFSKNFGLYGQRTGAFHFISQTGDSRHHDRIMQQLRHIIRKEYSVPPRFGCSVVKMILADKELKSQWLGDVMRMNSRLRQARQLLFEHLGGGEDWVHIVKQTGMFSYTGLSKTQVDVMRETYHVYMLSSGRISMSGLNLKNVAYVANAMKAVTQSS